RHAVLRARVKAVLSDCCSTTPPAVHGSEAKNPPRLSALANIEYSNKATNCGKPLSVRNDLLDTSQSRGGAACQANAAPAPALGNAAHRGGARVGELQLQQGRVVAQAAAGVAQQVCAQRLE